MPSKNYSHLPLDEFSTTQSTNPQHPQLENDDNLNDEFFIDDFTDDNNNDNTNNIHDTNNIDLEMPDLPPEYDPSGFEEFDIEERQATSTILRSKAEDFAKSFKKRIVQPINNALDPIYQLYCYSNARFEYYISKVGNPLIIKRMLYVTIIAIILYIASISGLNSDGVVGNRSDFTDPNKLNEFINLSVDRRRLEENLEYLSSMPHIAGTAGDLALSRYFEQLLIHSRLLSNPDIVYESFTNYPLDPKVQLLENDELIVDFDLEEAIEGDSSSSFYKLAFNPGSRDSSVKGKFVYVNYGTLRDYKLLTEKSVNVKGNIVIMKYGGLYSASKKLKYAQEHGAIGVLFISDPELDMYYDMESIQREPVAFAEIIPGDIAPDLSNSVITEDINELNEKLDKAPAAPNIPSIPIKWKDFITLMEKLSGKGERIPEWDFKINDKEIPIWLGDNSNYEIMLQNSLTTRPHKESWNILGKLDGREQDTFAVVIGASRDTMCFGAIESSGSAILLELINIFNEMSSSLFWRPLRSIYFVSFSGSKYNLAGSSSFASKNSEFFRRDVFAYIDLDDLIQGNDLEISADPLFHSIIKEAVERIKNTNSSDSSDYSNINIGDNLSNIDYKIDSTKNSFPLIKQHNIAGISFKLKDKQTKNFQVQTYPKNSCLDTFKNFKEKHIDDEMLKHSFMTKLVGSIIVKLADNPILPYDVKNMIEKIRINILEIEQYLEDIKHNLRFDDLYTMLDRVNIIAEQNEAFISTWADICDNGYGTEPNLLSVNRWDWNSKLLLMNKIILNIDGTYNDAINHNVLKGIERNPELRHDFMETEEIKYGLPGIWDAIDKEDWGASQDQIDLVTSVLDRCMKLFQY